LNNLDLTIILAKYKLNPLIDAMRQCLARMLGVTKDKISVKAKSKNGLGETGRGEAIEAHAVILLQQIVKIG